MFRSAGRVATAVAGRPSPSLSLRSTALRLHPGHPNANVHANRRSQLMALQAISSPQPRSIGMHGSASSRFLSTALLRGSTAAQVRMGVRSGANANAGLGPTIQRIQPTNGRATHAMQMIGASNHRHSRTILIQSNVGSVTHFSSFFGGGRRPPTGGNRLMQGAGLLSAGAMMFGKTKYLFAALKLTKFASLGSMVLTIGTYSMFFGAPYAIGVVGLTLVHEAGHALVMLQRGIPFEPMVFMPFVGAMIAMRQRPRDAWEDALIAFGGPALGSVGAGAVAVAAHMTQSQLLFAVADFGFMVNLFNLMPIGSMDGGRIAGALSKWSHVAGLGMGGALAFTGAVGNPIFYLILLSGGWETYKRFTDPLSVPPNYYRITTAQRVVIGTGYVGLIGALLLAQDLNHRYQKPPEVLIRENKEKSWEMM